MSLPVNFPDMLSAVLADTLEHIVFFFGAGISSSLSGKAYGWAQWVRDGIALLPEESDRQTFYEKLGDTPTTSGNPDADTLTSVLEEVIDSLRKTPGLYDEWMHEAFETSTVENDSLAATLKKMLTFSDIFVTTNYDSLLEQATNIKAASYLQPEIVYPMLEKGQNNYVIHIHGRYSTDAVNAEDSIIATDTQYRKLLDDQGAQFIQNTIGTKTIIFVGCGKTTSDQNISRFIKFAKDYLHLEKTSYFLHMSGEMPDDLPDHIMPVCSGDKYSDLPVFWSSLQKFALMHLYKAIPLLSYSLLRSRRSKGIPFHSTILQQNPCHSKEERRN